MFLLILLCSTVQPQTVSKDEVLLFLNNQAILSETILRDYRKDVPAVYIKDRYDSANLSLAVTIMYTYGQLLTLNEAEQSVTAIVEYYMSWTDPRLSWDPFNFDGIQIMVVKSDQIWIPDVWPVGIISYRPMRLSNAEYVQVHFNGSTSYTNSHVVTIPCILDVTNFPFDTQLCETLLSSHNFLSSELSLELAVAEQVAAYQLNEATETNGEWTLSFVDMQLDTERETVFGRKYPQIKMSYRLTRNPSYFIILIIIPSFVITILAICGIFWSEINKETSLEKLNLGFAAILAMIMVLQITTDNMPKTSQVPILSYFILNNLLLVAIAVLAVMGTSKYLTVSKNRTSSTESEAQSKGRIIAVCCNVYNQLLQHIHSIYLVFFILGSLTNLSVLCFKRVENQRFQ